MKNIGIVGCGYVGSRFAARSRQKKHFVTAISRISRATDGISKFANIADATICAHWCDASINRIGTHFDTLLVSVSHRREDKTAGAVQNDHAFGLENLLSHMVRPPRLLIYLSTTGVYQTQRDGQWLTEVDPCDPDRPGAENAYSAEQWIANAAQHYPQTQMVVLRPAGIYGPDRIPNLVALRNQSPIAVDPAAYLNLIHVVDLVNAIELLSESTKPAKHLIYNISDNQPPTRGDYYAYLSSLIGAPTPRFATAGDPNSPAPIRARGQGSKRISNARFVSEFGWQPSFADYRSGLSAIVTA